MFQFPGLASHRMGCNCFTITGCPIRKSTDQWLFAPPHSLSQLVTSFFASESLGILHTPFVTFFLFLLVTLFYFLSFQYVKEPLLNSIPAVTNNRDSNLVYFYCSAFELYPWFCSKNVRGKHPKGMHDHLSLERRCSSHTFRYGYLVTT